MTVSIPARPREVPSVPGNPARVTDCANDILRASSSLDDVDTAANAQSTLEGWAGKSAETYRVRVEHAGENAATASLTLRAAAKAMWDYGDELSRLQYRLEGLVGSRASLKARLDLLGHDVERATEEEQSELHGRASDLGYEIARYYDAECSSLERAVAANNAALKAALAPYLDVDSARRVVGSDVAESLLSRDGSPTRGSTPQEVADWWVSLTEEERFALIAAYPEVIGAADGLSAAVRDKANRLMLKNDLAELAIAEQSGVFTAEQLANRDNVYAARDALALCENYSGSDPTTIDPITDEHIPAALLLYRPSAFGNDGAIAIAIGDPDTADNVSVSVPGIRTEGTSAKQYSEEARNLYESARLSDPSSTTATIAWIGYDSPSGWDIGNTVSESAAITGGEKLSNYVSGLQASREGDPPHMTVIGHSYGSTTSAHGASDHGLDVDELVLIGSPGAGGEVDNAADLSVPQVWAGDSSRDMVAALSDDGWVGGHTLLGAGLGNDVAEDDFGAIRFQAEDETRNSAMRNFGDHTKYYHRGTEAIYNMGQIVVGDDSEVNRAEYVHDPWYDAPQDPEADRTPTSTIPHSTRDENVALRSRRE